MTRSFDSLFRVMIGAAGLLAMITSTDALAAPRRSRRGAPPKTQVDTQAPAAEAAPALVPKADGPAAETRTPPSVEPPPQAAPREKPSIFTPPETTWPVYVLGAVGIVGLGSAAIFGGLRANAEHSADVAGAALIRKGKPPALCNAQPVEFAYAEICAHLQKNKRIAESHASWVLPSLIVGATATAAAIGWFFFAPKEGAEKVGAPRVVPWVGVEGGGASVIGRF